MELWRKTWREGVAPLLQQRSLTALLLACETDDPRLVQRVTTVPPPMPELHGEPCKGACALGFAGLAIGLTTVGEVEGYFSRTALAIDERLGIAQECRWFFNWFDETPRHEMLPLLAEEIRHELAVRAGKAVAA